LTSRGSDSEQIDLLTEFKEHKLTGKWLRWNVSHILNVLIVVIKYAHMHIITAKYK